MVSEWVTCWKQVQCPPLSSPQWSPFSVSKKDTISCNAYMYAYAVCTHIHVTTITLCQHVTASVMLSMMMTTVNATHTIAMETKPAFCSNTPPMRKMNYLDSSCFLILSIEYNLCLKTQGLPWHLPRFQTSNVKLTIVWKVTNRYTCYKVLVNHFDPDSLSKCT